MTERPSRAVMLECMTASLKLPQRVLAASALIGGLLLAGCSSVPGTTAPAAPPATASAAAPTAAAELLARHDLQGLTVQQVIERLDAGEDDRTAGPVGSVRPGELILNDQQGQASLPIPGDTFYLAIAPYLTTTHDCFNHNLATCKGELAGQTVHVTITDAAGATLVDRDVTTHPNGFAGLWLPRNIRATLTVTYDGKSATSALGTGASDPTCLTTLQLR